MNIGEILSRAWKIVWKHKILWLFGILASCGQASGSSSGGSSGGGSGGSSQAIHLPTAWLADVGNMEWFVVLLLVAAGIIFIIFLVLLAMAFNTVGRVGVVRGVLQAEEGKEKLSFGLNSGPPLRPIQGIPQIVNSTTSASPSMPEG